MGHHGPYYTHGNQRKCVLCCCSSESYSRILGYYGYPPVSEHPPNTTNGTKPDVFYCIQEDLNTTLVNTTLDKDGFGVCNVSGKLVTCPIEIECKISEADTCCEGDQSKILLF